MQSFLAVASLISELEEGSPLVLNVTKEPLVL